MRIAVVGCGYVADHYMDTLSLHSQLELAGVWDKQTDRAKILADRHQLNCFTSLEDVLSEETVELVVNLTDPDNHYKVSKACLLSGKHVYSEKPLATTLHEARELVAIAAERNLLISSAPCSILSETAQTMWKAVDEGAVGEPRLVYAELDDNPIYLMHPEGWRNEAGVPWPYLNEYEVGCTLEHAGYYLTWLAAIFGPAESVTAFSSCVATNKTDIPLERSGTPDFSVACIAFRSGVVARLTCSIVAPYDHRLRIIGDRGELSCNECWNYSTPVFLERFTNLNLNARKARSVRSSTLLQKLFGVGGDKQRLTIRPPSQWRLRWNEIRSGRRSLMRTMIKVVSKRQLVNMDFFRGVAEMVDSLNEDRRCQIPPDFVLHVNELTLAIQNGGKRSETYEMTTTFEPIEPRVEHDRGSQKYSDSDSGILRSAVNKVIALLHRH